MGHYQAETSRMKSILEESRKKFVEELDQRMPTTANNMPWSATGDGIIDQAKSCASQPSTVLAF